MHNIEKPAAKKRKEKVRVQTVIDKDVYDNIVKKYLEEYEFLNKVLEEALICFDKHKKTLTEIGDKYDQLLIRLKNEVGLTALGFTAFEHLCAGRIDRVVEENGLEYAIEWLYNKPMSEISIEETLEAIKDIWIATNRVHNVSINKTDSEIHMIFHSKIGPNSDRLFCEAIKVLLERTYDVDVSYSIKPHGYSISIKLLSSLTKKRKYKSPIERS